MEEIHQEMSVKDDEDCTESFPCAVTRESDADVNRHCSTDKNEEFSSPALLSSLRRRRSLSHSKSGEDSDNFGPSVSFETCLDSRAREFGLQRQLVEMEKDKKENLKNVENANVMQVDLNGGSEKRDVDEENEESSIITDADNVLMVNSDVVDSCLEEDSVVKEFTNGGVDNSEVVDSRLSEIEDSVITDIKNDGVDNSEVVDSHLREIEDSVITDFKNDGVDNSEVVYSHLREMEDLSSNILLDLANFVTKAIGFQVNVLITLVSLMIKFFMFPVWLIYSSYMFVMDPFQIMRRGKQYVYHKFMKSFLFVFTEMMNSVSELLKDKSMWRLGLKFGWGCVWCVYVCVVLVGLLVSAFMIGGILMSVLVEEPIRMKEQPLNFDYTVKSPVAFVPIIRSPGLTCGIDVKDHLEVRVLDGVRVVPPSHRLQVTVSLTLPESDYNRNLGIFQVRVDFLAANGEVLASKKRPSMLQFKSHPIRLLLTFLKAAPLVTGYTSESQKLNIDLKGFTEGFIPTACLRVIIEQRAEFHPGGGIPEMYAASLSLESELPLLKRIIWYWKTAIYLWVSMTLFTMELLFTLLCCKPLIIPRVLRLRHDSNRGNT